jgi:hypothetical protein
LPAKSKKKIVDMAVDSEIIASHKSEDVENQSF